MKTLVLFLTATIVCVQSCDIGRPVSKIEEHLSISIDNPNIDRDHLLNTLIQEYATYNQIASLYYTENTTEEVKSCLCKYLKFALQTLEFGYAETELCLDTKDVRDCLENNLNQNNEKLLVIQDATNKCYE